jgi:hypothetical protein
MLESIDVRRMPGTGKEHDQVTASCCQECQIGLSTFKAMSIIR